ncbi:MAG: HU family DNA-binding protein [Desulfovibrio sp.]|jgi:nucleoid DNA-binding protein|nr:HU family DNA-binding protein [Desulfovibrio sp.]
MPHPRVAFNRSAFIERIHDELGVPLKTATAIAQTLIDLCIKSIVEEGDLSIRNFGRFHVQEKRERKGRDPVTGKDTILPAHKGVVFKYAEALRLAMNQSGPED